MLTVAAYRVEKVATIISNELRRVIAVLGDEFEEPAVGIRGPSQTPSVLFAVCRAAVSDIIVSNPCPAVRNQLAEPQFRRATFGDIERVAAYSGFDTGLQEKQKETLAEDIKDGKYLDIEITLGSSPAYSTEPGEKLLILDTDHIGQAVNAEEGDYVMVFQGAETPFLVVPLGEMEIEGIGKQVVLSIVDVACIIGVMDGEIVEQIKKDGKMAELVYSI